VFNGAVREARRGPIVPSLLPPASVLLALTSCGGSAPAAPAVSVEVAGYHPARAEDLRAAGWRTDLTRALVPLAAIRIGAIDRDAFVPIDSLRFAPAAEVGLAPAEPLLVHRGAEGLRAWPLAHLLRRELARDEVDGVPAAVTLCSLCAGARVWDLRLDGLDGEVLELAVSGLLLDGNALLYDRATESLWRQLDGLSVAGAHAGRRLRPLPAFTVSFGALREAHPDALVMLAPEPGRDPPLDWISADEVERGEPPPWLGTTCASPLALTLAWEAGEGGALVLADPASAAPHRASGGGIGPARGSSAAFRPHSGDRALTFDHVPGGALDRETGSRWNSLGEAVAGPLRGRCLEPLPQVWAFRFALPRGGH